MAKIIVMIAKTTMKQLVVEAEEDFEKKDLEDLVAESYPDYEIVEIIPLDKST